MTESYKYKSKIATAVSFIAAFIVYIGKDGLSQIIPSEYSWTISILIIVAGYIVTQKTEDKRVNVAEELVHEQYNDPTADEIEEDDIVVGDDEDDSGC